MQFVRLINLNKIMVATNFDKKTTSENFIWLGIKGNSIILRGNYMFNS